MFKQLSFCFLTVFIFVANLKAQDSVGFIDSLSNVSTSSAQLEWRESKLNGEWYNISFIDSTRFLYRLKTRREAYKPLLSSSNSINAANAILGDFSTSHWGPKFMLLGYIKEDSLWCIIPAALSPEYIHFATPNQCEIQEQWCQWHELLSDSEVENAKFKFQETSVDHNFTIWGRLPPGKTVQVWWGADAIACWDIDDNSEIQTPTNIAVLSSVVSQPARWFNTLDDYMKSGSGLWNFVGEYCVEYPTYRTKKERKNWVNCRFVERINRDGSNADDWLPEPGKEIGLVFEFERYEKQKFVEVEYNIFNISTWQGECMNYPVNATRPRATGSNSYFDFSIVDTTKYSVAVHDLTFTGQDSRGSIDKRSVCGYAVSSSLRYSGRKTTIYDTVWLKSRDYGAKAMVSASIGKSEKRLMQPHTTSFGQHVWAVSVPRDDDGLATVGYNSGDFMADAWEEAVIGLPSMSDSSAILDFTSFYTKDSSGHRVYADQDYLPAGRQINGDGFCNWEEYRGFITVGNQYGFYPSSNPYQHKRLNPSQKEVMVHFMPNVECMNDAPGWISALPDTMVYLVEHLTSLTNSDSVRLRLHSRVNTNKYGAHYPYYSRKASFDNTGEWTATDSPAADGYQNAVEFGAQYRGYLDSLMVANPFPLGYVKAVPGGAFSEGATIPKYSRQVISHTDNIDLWVANLPYYQNNLQAFLDDSDKQKRKTIAHELGHAIGMPHDPFILLKQYIMAKSSIADDSTGQIYLDPPTFTRQYSDSSKAKISILMKEKP